MNIYSPSKTEAYDACSLKGRLMYTDHWEPKEANNGTVGKIAGSAFAKGSESIHLGASHGVDVAYAYWDAAVSWYIKHGVSFSMDLGKAKNVLGNTLVKYHANNPFKLWTIEKTELQLKYYGNCRLDVVGVDPEGYIAIADTKYKRSLKTDYLDKTVSEYKDSWQFQHYPWAYNSWVTTQAGPMIDRTAARMWLVLVIAEPFKVYSYPFFVNTQLQPRWLVSAQQKWADIAALESGERQPVMAAVHRDQYGDCPMKEACLEMNLNVDLMAFKYTVVPRMPEGGLNG